MTNLFKQSNLRIALWATNTTYQQLTEKLAQNNPSGIYELKCNTSNKAYIEQSGGFIAVRHKEHVRYIRTNNPTSAYALLTYSLLTPWSRVLLEKLTGSAASQEIPRIFGTRRFITVPTTARHLSLSWANSIQSSQPPATSRRSILILSPHLRLGLPSGLFPSGFPTRTLCTPLPFPHTRHMPRPSHSSRFYHPHNIR